MRRVACSGTVRRRWRRAGPFALGPGLIAAFAMPLMPAMAQSTNIGPRSLETTLSAKERSKWWNATKRWGAQDALSQSREVMRPGGIRIGRFDFAPTLGTKFVYDDNIFASSTNRRGDFYTEIAPGLSVSTETARHYFNVTAGAKAYKYAKYDDFDAVDLAINASGAVQVNRAHVVYATVSHALVHEDSLSYVFPENNNSWHTVANFNAAERIPVLATYAEAGLSRDAGRLNGAIRARYGYWDYRDIQSRTGGSVDQDYRDMRTFAGEARLGYRFSPGYELETLFTATRYDFLDPVSDYANGWRYEAGVGLEFETGPLLQWQLGGGYAWRTYDDPALESTGDYVARVGLRWLATDRLTLKAEAQRRLSVYTSETDVGSALTHSAQVSADLELYRNLIFTIKGEYSDVRDLDSSTRSEVYRAGVRLQYYSTQNWVASVGYDYIERQSDIADLNLSRNQFSGRVQFKF